MGERRLLISFSGGETSALMSKLIMERMADRYDEIHCVFANTGQENEQTLEFVQRCDEAFGLGVVWVEAVVNQRGVGSTHRIVDFQTANRDGAVFEAVIDKYGIPNADYPHCTRELKANPIQSYVRGEGWAAGTYDLAIGIRIDEADRMAPNAKQKRIIYPLVAPHPHRKVDVNEFWHRQPFRLGLKGYQGNCKWCWKKSRRKHMTLMRETPEIYDFPERMEREKGHCGAGDAQRVFFRENRSVADLRRLAAVVPVAPAIDDARVYQPDLFPPFSFDLDAADGCSEHCEVDFDMGDAA